MSDTRPISGDLEEMRTWLSASAEGTDGSVALAVVASPTRPETALDGGARGCPVVEVVFTELWFCRKRPGNEWEPLESNGDEINAVTSSYQLQGRTVCIPLQ